MSVQRLAILEFDKHGVALRGRQESKGELYIVHVQLMPNAPWSHSARCESDLTIFNLDCSIWVESSGRWGDNKGDGLT